MGNPPITPVARLPNAGVLLAAQIAYEVRLLLKSGRALAVGIGLPVILLIASKGKAGHPNVAGYAAFGVTITAWSTYGVRLVAAREAGILKRWRATPLPRWCFFAASILATTLIAVMAAAVTVAAAALIYGTDFGHGPTYHLTVSGAIAILAALTLAGLAWSATATAITRLIPTVDAAFPILILTYFPVIIISGVLFTVNEAHWLSDLAGDLPAKPLVDALEGAVHHTPGAPWLPTRSIIVLTAWAAAGLAVAVAVFQWEPHRPSRRRGASRGEPSEGTHVPIWIAIGLTIVAVVAAGTIVLAAAGGSPAQLLAPSCAWPAEANLDVLAANNKLNVHNPDTQAAYWIMPYTVQPGLRITLAGRYIDSRYMSISVYDSHGLPFTSSGASSALTDYQIMPDPGDVNPWRHPARPGGSFTVTVRGNPSRGATNTLPLAPTGTAAGTTGLMFFRAYVPVGADPRRVRLPTVTFARGGHTRKLVTCTPTSHPRQQVLDQISGVEGIARTQRQGQPQPTLTQLRALLGPTGILPFSRGPAALGSTPDVGSSYLSAVVLSPRPGNVLVIRAKAPTTPRGPDPSPWPAPGVDLRYWSMCIDRAAQPRPVVINHLGRGKLDYGCRYDNLVRLDRDGYYTFVVGTEAQRSTIENISEATFLPFSVASPDQPYILNLRNLLANPSFTDTALNVPTDADPAAAAAVMGPYYPREGFCPLSTLASKGPTACLTTRRRQPDDLPPSTSHRSPVASVPDARGDAAAAGEHRPCGPRRKRDPDDLEAVTDGEPARDQQDGERDPEIQVVGRAARQHFEAPFCVALSEAKNRA